MEVAGGATTILPMNWGYGNRRSHKIRMEIRWVSSRSRGRDYNDGKQKRRVSLLSKIPIYISTNPSHINPLDLRELYATCNHCCHRFPKLDDLGNIIEPPVDLTKLCKALSHSSVLVSVFCNFEEEKETDFGIDTNDDTYQEEENEANEQLPPPPPSSSPLRSLGDLFERVMPLPLVSPSNGRLVGFGRAVSDVGLTASIYDVMVVPSLREMGIGKIIVERILRILTNRDIYDIAALCSADERLFFKACGFGNDILGSTTMMYTRTVSSMDSKGDEIVKCAGRKVLVAPPLIESFGSLKNRKPQS